MLGEINDQGQIVQDVTVCALTGKTIVPGDAMVRIKGTKYFYRVQAMAWRQFPREERPALEQQLLDSAGVALPSSFASSDREALPTAVEAEATNESPFGGKRRSRSETGE